MAVTDYSVIPGNNTTISGISIAPNCPPGNIDNALRQVMADVATGLTDNTFSGGTWQPADATLTALAGVTTAADKLIYATGADTFATTDTTAYGRGLLALANVAALKATLSLFEVSAASLANPGYIKFSNNLMLKWGTGTLAGNSAGTITYSGPAYASWAVCNASGGTAGTSSEGDIHPTAAAGLSSQAIVNSGSGSGFYSYIAIGV